MPTPYLVSQYLSLIEQHVIDPLQQSALAESCYATLLMVFGCIDGLGKLIHARDDAGAGARFKYFIARLGPEYDACTDHLWELRNSVAHNALNVAAYLSNVPSTSDVHLKTSSSGTQFVVNTRCLLDDFVKAFNVLKNELDRDSDFAKLAESRLTYGEIPATEFQHYPTTAPPPVQFVQIRGMRFDTT
jgi:hypothetical protein